MRSRMIAVTTGFMLAAIQPSLMPLQCYMAIALAVSFISIKYSNIALKYLNYSVLGFSYASVCFTFQLSSKLPETLKRTDWNVTGVIHELKQDNADVMKLTVELTDIKSAHVVADIRPKPPIKKIRVAWYQPTETLSIGDTVKMTVRLKPPHGQLNPEAFDYEKWLFVKGIDATGYVRAFDYKKPSEQSYMREVRTHIAQLLSEQFLNQRTEALYKAITIGDKTHFTLADWQALKKTGTVHLAVISGLHIGFIAGLGWFLGRCATRFLSGPPSLAFIFSLSLSAAYLSISGFGLPAQRAFIMLSVFIVASWQSFRIDPWTRWWIAIVSVLVINPIAIYEMGFWLSFWAVALLIMLSDAKSKLTSLLRIQLGLMLGMLPFYLLFFSGISLVAPIVNLIAIPAFGILIPVLFLHLLLGSLGINLFTGLLDDAAQLFWFMIDYVSELQLSYAEYENSSFLALIMVTLATVILFLRSLSVSPYVAIMLILPFILGAPVNGLSTEKGIWIYDVGQGLSVLVKSHDYYLLYDTGPAYRNGKTAFEYSVLPHLQNMGAKTIDTLIISHDDNDHSGGKDAVLENFKVGQIYTSDPNVSSGHKQCTEGIRWHEDDTYFRFIHGSVGGNDNDRSCVLLIEMSGCRLLLPGDIGKGVEIVLKDRIGQVNWLVASHHGSDSSSDALFLKAIQPDTVIFSSGYANHFNHPHPNVVSRVNQVNAKMLNTASMGAIFLNPDSELGCFDQSFRDLTPRLWR